MSDLKAEVSSLEAKLSSALSELEDVAKERDSAVGERQHLMEANKEVGERRGWEESGGKGRGGVGMGRPVEWRGVMLEDVICFAPFSCNLAMNRS